MKNEINLLPKRKSRSNKETKDIKPLRYLTLGSILLVTVPSVGAFLITAVSPLESLKKEEEQKTQEFNALRLKTTKYVLTSGRLDEITQLLASRVEYGRVLEEMTNATSPDLLYTKVTFGLKTLTLEVASPSLSTINSYLTQLKEKNDQKRFKNLSISKMEYSSEDNLYVISFSVAI